MNPCRSIALAAAVLASGITAATATGAGVVPFQGWLQAPDHVVQCHAHLDALMCVNRTEATVINPIGGLHPLQGDPAAYRPDPAHVYIRTLAYGASVTSAGYRCTVIFGNAVRCMGLHTGHTVTVGHSTVAATSQRHVR